MEKKYKIQYGCITERKAEGGWTEKGLHNGGEIATLFEFYESWNSQYRSKKFRESRENIKLAIFGMLYHLDKSMVFYKNSYQSLIENGVSENDIEYDENKILDEIESVWSRWDIKSSDRENGTPNHSK